MATIEETISAAKELNYGDKEPLWKLALYGAAMSPVQDLHKNGLQNRILARYAEKPLPTDRQVLFEELKEAKGNIYGTHLNALYRIEKLYPTLEQFKDLPEGREAQIEWRELVLSYLTGHGMGRKTISLAALILDSDRCELVPIDRYVLRRMDIKKDSIASYKEYLAIEQRHIEERAQAGYPNIPLGLWHWYKWEEYRQAVGKSKVKEGVQSHKNLSCRWY